MHLLQHRRVERRCEDAVGAAVGVLSALARADRADVLLAAVAPRLHRSDVFPERRALALHLLVVVLRELARGEFEVAFGARVALLRQHAALHLGARDLARAEDLA
eukprot:4582433-Pleurochrysis_carterae.AAC.2